MDIVFLGIVSLVLLGISSLRFIRIGSLVFLVFCMNVGEVEAYATVVSNPGFAEF